MLWKYVHTHISGRDSSTCCPFLGFFLWYCLVSSQLHTPRYWEHVVLIVNRRAFSLLYMTRQCSKLLQYVLKVRTHTHTHTHTYTHTHKETSTMPGYIYQRRELLLRWLPLSRYVTSPLSSTHQRLRASIVRYKPSTLLCIQSSKGEWGEWARLFVHPWWGPWAFKCYVRPIGHKTQTMYACTHACT